MNTEKDNNLLVQQFSPSFEIILSENLDKIDLLKENKILKKRITELSFKNRRENYENEKTIRKQRKKIQQLTQEINVLKIVIS